MPLRGYFLYIGSALLALLLILNWYFPQPDAGPVRSDVDRSTIRIHSTHRWPQAVVIDTTLPTIVPPVTMTAAAPAPPPPAKPAREAFAMATDPVALANPVEAVKPAKPHVRRTRTARAPAGQGAGPEPFGFGNDWFAPPRREAFAFRNEGFGSRGFWPSSR